MAIGLRLKFAGATQDQYEAVHSGMGIAENPPDGLLFHAAGPIDEGWGVIDFWASREHFDRFLQDRLGPKIQELGDRAPQSPPEIKEFQVHNYEKP